MKELNDEYYQIETGFNLNDPDDETFYLEKIGQYPDNLPYEPEVLPKPEDIESQFAKIDAQKDADIEKEVTIPTVQSQPTEESLAAESKSVSPRKKGIAEEEDEELIYGSFREGYEIEEKQPKLFEKQGLVDREVRDYEKKGRVADEQEDFEKSGRMESPLSQEEEKIESIWDIFEKEQPESRTSVEETPTKPQPAEDVKVAEEVSKPEESTQSETPKVETVLIESDSIVDIPIEIKIAKYDQGEFEKVLDPSFKSQILEDLEKSKSRRKPKAKEEEVPIEQISESEKEELQRELNQDAQPEDVKYIEVDLSSIKVTKPSEIIAGDLISQQSETDFLGRIFKRTKKEKKEQKKKEEKIKKEKKLPKKVQEEVSTEAIAETVEEAQPEEVKFAPKEDAFTPKVEKEEKRRRRVPILWFVIAFLALLLVISGVYLYYKGFWKSKIPEKQELAKKKEVEKVKEPIPLTAPTADTNFDVKQGQAIADEKVEAKAAPTEIEPKEKVKEQPKGAEILKPKPETKIVEVKKPSHEKPKEIAKSEVSPKPRPEPLPLPKEKPEVKIVEEKQQQFEYSIEVFSSTEPEDAIFWSTTLNKKGINAYIKIHRIRNVNFYKVRIGNFRSIEEATNFAKSLGFRNIWIDRVK